MDGEKGTSLTRREFEAVKQELRVSSTGWSAARISRRRLRRGGDGSRARPRGSESISRVML